MSLMTPAVIGKIYETEKYEVKEIKWKITDFSLLPKEEDDEYDEDDDDYDVDVFRRSPTFSFADVLWNLQLNICSGPAELFLLAETEPKYSVEYNFGLEKVDGSIEIAEKGIKETNEMCDSLEFDLHQVQQLDSGFLPSDVLTIMCTLKCKSRKSRRRSKNLLKLDTLSQNLKDLFANKETCDATLCVKNKEYKAHKAILTARSSVFSKMFQHDMSEKQTGIIMIPDCDPDTFGEFLEYLYCGKIEAISYSSAISLYKTSDKYNVQELKTFCCEQLMVNLTIKNLCDVGTLADMYDDEELISAVQKFFNKNLNAVVKTTEWEHLMQNHYRLANKLLITMPKMKIVESYEE